MSLRFRRNGDFTVPATSASGAAVLRRRGLLTLLRTKNPDILEDIRKTGDLSDATAAKLKGVVDGYAKTFA